MDDEKHHDGPLTTAELSAVRSLIEQERRYAWLRSTVRAWALAVAAIVTGATLGLDALRQLIKRLIT